MRNGGVTGRISRSRIGRRREREEIFCAQIFSYHDFHEDLPEYPYGEEDITLEAVSALSGVPRDISEMLYTASRQHQI